MLQTFHHYTPEKNKKSYLILEKCLCSLILIINILYFLVGDVKQTSDEKLNTDSHALAELEQQIRISAEAAVNAYYNAVHIIKQYNQV